MKKIVVVDTIIEDKSISQIGHLKEILGVNFRDFQFKEIHLAVDKLDKRHITECDAVIFSGSYKSVYEEFEWKKNMHETWEAVLVTNKPTLATCFGAQFLAFHLGARVIKNPRGVEFGPVRINLTEEGKSHKLLDGFDQGKFVFATHQDIVERLPAGATLLAHNENSPIQAFQYGTVLATQFHSDIPTSRARQLLELRKEKYLKEGILKDDFAYQKMMEELPLGESSHQILRGFLNNI